MVGYRFLLDEDFGEGCQRIAFEQISLAQSCLEVGVATAGSKGGK